MAKNPTLREIAKACQVSHSTVSRALSNHSRIPEATRKRIRAKAESLGWKSNPFASAYMAHVRSTRTPQFQAALAYVITSSRHARMNELPDYHQTHFAGAKQRASALGYSLEPVWLRELDFSPRRLERFLKNRSIPGLILYGSQFPSETFRSFDWGSFAMASWGVSLALPQLHHAACHYLHGLRLILEKIRSYGYRRIAIVLSANQDELSDHAFFSAFHYQEKHPRAGEWLKSMPPYPAHKDNAGRIRRWIEQHRPEAIIGDEIVWSTLGEMNWKIPDDVAYVSPFWSSKWPGIGGLDQRPEIIGANSVDLVSMQLLQNEYGVPATPKLLLNEGQWKDGPSIPRRKSL